MMLGELGWEGLFPDLSNANLFYCLLPSFVEFLSSSTSSFTSDCSRLSRCSIFCIFLFLYLKFKSRSMLCERNLLVYAELFSFFDQSYLLSCHVSELVATVSWCTLESKPDVNTLVNQVITLRRQWHLG